MMYWLRCIKKLNNKVKCEIFYLKALTKEELWTFEGSKFDLIFKHLFKIEFSLFPKILLPNEHV
jgi:hypothetical protein